MKKDYLKFTQQLPKDLSIQFIPLSALDGDNVTTPSKNMLWYNGPTIFYVLYSVDVIKDREKNPLCFPVQYVNRTNQFFRWYAGTLSAGCIQVGKYVKVLPSCIKYTVAQIINFNGEVSLAVLGEAITIVLKEEVDISRGDMLVDISEKVMYANSALVEVVWMYKKPLILGKSYEIKI